MIPAPISVAMATFNGARFIREQLDSIAAQTVPPAELIITDDGSTDGTLAIVRDFAATAFFPVHVHRNPVRLGYRENFLRAIALCTSEVIALCDQDDVWEPEKLQLAVAPFKDPEVVLAYHDAWLIDEAGVRMGLARIHGAPARNPPSSLFPLHNPYGFSMLFRRRLGEFADLWPRSVDNLHARERMAHDQWLFFLACAFGTIAFVEEPLAGYRQHGDNTYGVERPIRTRWDRIERWINVRSREFGSFATAAGVRAAILEEAGGRLDPAWHARADLATARYRRLSRHCSWRADVYDAKVIASRLRAWIALLGDGAYGNATRWTFGRKAALVDLGCLIASRWMLSVLTVRHHTASAAPFISGQATPGENDTAPTTRS